jgi:hypothetical protein
MVPAGLAAPIHKLDVFGCCWKVIFFRLAVAFLLTWPAIRISLHSKTTTIEGPWKLHPLKLLFLP